MSAIIVEGVDRCGKDSLIQGIISKLGYHHQLHYSKPIVPNCYSDEPREAAFEYQKMSFIEGFELLNQPIKVIFNRFHLGEVVYAPRYRGYEGNYVFQIEYNYKHVLPNMRLILLYSDCQDIFEDDYKSFDYNKRGEETEDFLRAARQSRIQNKIMINVHNGQGGYRPFQDILDEALTFLEKTYYE